MLEGDGSDTVRVWRFGEFVLDTVHRRLLRNDETVRVDERPFDLLVLLASNWDRPLDRREITTALWGARPVSDNTLRQLLYKARRAVDDDGEHQNIIRTLHGRSLQWVAPLEPLAEAPLGEQPPRVRAREGTGALRRSVSWVGAALAVVLVVGVVALLVPRTGSPEHAAITRLAIEPINNASGDKQLDWVGAGLPGLLGGLLGEDGGVDVVASSRVTQALSWKRPVGRTVDQQIRFVTGATAVLHGELHKLSTHVYELRLRLQVDTANDPASMVITGDNPATLAANAVPRIRHALGLVAIEATSRAPRDPFFAEAYARGMSLLDQGKANDARHYFAVCVKSDPTFLPAQFQLALVDIQSDAEAAGRALLKHTLKQAQKVDDAHLAGLILLWLGGDARTASHEAQALDYLRQALPYLRQSKHMVGQIEAHLLMADSASTLDQPTLADQEMAAAKKLLAAHPELRHARVIMYEIEDFIALKRGDSAAALKAAHAALALQQTMGNERSALVGMINIAVALHRSHRNDEALAVIARAWQRACKTNYSELEFLTAGNLAIDLTSMGLYREATLLTRQMLSLSEREHGVADQVVALQLQAIAELSEGDAKAAQESLAQGDKRIDPHTVRADMVMSQSLYKALVAFSAAPQSLAVMSRRFDAFAGKHAKVSGSAHRQYLLQALVAAVANDPKRALAALKSAAAAAHSADDGDIELRMAPLLVALQTHDPAAASVALAGYNPDTANEASVLALYVRWMHSRGDARDAARGEKRLAQLRQSARAGLTAVGITAADLSATVSHG